jgi:GNAT superfamily N-acetyltransferase
MGHYSLVFSSVKQEDAAVSIREAMPANYPAPVMLFARFAVDRKLQGRGVGTSLLKDAFLRTVEASEIGGLAAILVDAIDDKMVTFYKNYGFRECPAAERKLMIAIKDVRAHLLGTVVPQQL